jgi:hypothetical protein
VPILYILNIPANFCRYRYRYSGIGTGIPVSVYTGLKTPINVYVEHVHLLWEVLRVHFSSDAHTGPNKAPPKSKISDFQNFIFKR